MNWKFITFLFVIAGITGYFGYTYEIINYHYDDAATWAVKGVVVIICIVGIVFSLISVFAKRRGLPQIVVFIVIIISWIAALFAGNIQNKRYSELTRKNADSIIWAMNKYYADSQRFPETSKQLIPKYISKIPSTELGRDEKLLEVYCTPKQFSVTYEDLKGVTRYYSSNKNIWETFQKSFE